jgi:hypothetical protein
MQEIFFLMRPGFTFLVSLILKITELGHHTRIIPTKILRCHCIQLKLVFRLQHSEGELLTRSSLMKPLTFKDTKDSFLNHL